MEPTKYVIDIASTNPIIIGPETLAWSAEQLAEQHHVHYLLVVDGYELQGVVCLCDLTVASASTRVGDFMHRRPTTVDDQATATQAADLMSHCQIGCLPVVDWSGGLRGILTHHDLEQAGVVDRKDFASCATCGSSHGLGEVGMATGICVRCTSDAAARSPTLVEATAQPRVDH